MISRRVLITATMDFIVTTGTAITTVMVSNGEAAVPSVAAIIVATIGGAVAFARTVQQAYGPRR